MKAYYTSDNGFVKIVKLGKLAVGPCHNYAEIFNDKGDLAYVPLRTLTLKGELA